MQITHPEARKLIQFGMDRMLKPQEKNTLQIHLEDCVECRTFAEEIREVSNLLQPVMRKHWNIQPIPFSIETITSKRKSQLQPKMILVTRMAIISIVCAAFVFSAWQFILSGKQTSDQLPVGVLPVPTPSSQSTSTKTSVQNCEGIKYQVQESDTLESIAAQFSIAKYKLMAINNLSAETVPIKMELLIPICNSTPTGTVHPSTLTITFTPLIRPTTSTPGG
jgi:LysM repeat protein